MKNYNFLNNATGWIVWLVATVVYLMTIEPTVSFWDCGEYIATAYKLEVGHPPGAPFFLLIGRFFSLFAFGDVTQVAKMVNILSALCSSFTILFLFWTITALAKKMVVKTEELTRGSTLAILGSGVVGALAYTFSDSFWFSAVEGEVYAMSSFFTALVFWCILKWEAVADEPKADRWLVLIAYLMGLSIGVHLLNLLAIPAIGYVYYFKKYKPTRKGLIIAGVASVGILLFIQYGMVQQFIQFAAQFELFFVNSLGLPFGSGAIFYTVLIIVGIVWALKYTAKKMMPLMNTAILCFAFILIGYSSFGVIMIRSAADPPMDENNPENVFTMLSYLLREQYGDRPLGYGQQFTAGLDSQDEGDKIWAKGKDKYEVIGRKIINNYDPEHCTVFPRMWSGQGQHKNAYREWSGMGNKKKASFFDNMQFFFSYQLGQMYWRYFAWNFIGRQNDHLDYGSLLDGNWISGIPFIDNFQIGSSDKYPESMKWEKAMNKFYFLPLILGLIGFFYHLNNNKKSTFVVFLMFFFTGIAINIYLNQYPFQPRERDYAYVGSFYAFAIWMGMGVLGIYSFLKNKIPREPAAIVSTVICLLMAPYLMASEGWDDHDRSKRYTARDFAHNYLNSCAPNAILFTNGDNDTFPLWYAQEVEGIRTDVRVVNLSLLNTDWYIDQMKRKAYDSDPVPFSLTPEQYKQGTRDQIYYYDKTKYKDRFVNVDEIIKFIASDDVKSKLTAQNGSSIDFYPTNSMFVTADSLAVIENGTVRPEDAGKVVEQIPFMLDKKYLMKAELMILDLLATNNWERPVYFAITVGSNSYMNLEDYFQLEGLAYRLVPIKRPSHDGQKGWVATDVMYDNIMNKFKWGGMDTKGVYMDENNLRMTMNFRNNFARLAAALLQEGKKDSAKAVLDKSLEIMPEENVPYNFFILPTAELYYQLGEKEKGTAIAKRLAEILEDDLEYYLSLEPGMAKNVRTETDRARGVLQRIVQITAMNGEKDLSEDIRQRYTNLDSLYQQGALK